MNTRNRTDDFFNGCDPVPAGRTLEVDIATASRVGLDGVSVDRATVDRRGHLLLALSDGSSLDAGRVVGPAGLSGLAHPDTIPAPSADPQLYIATAKGVYGHFRDGLDRPVEIAAEGTVGFLFRPGGDNEAWEYTAMTLPGGGSARPFAGKKIVLYGDGILLGEGATEAVRQAFGTDEVTVTGFDRTLACASPAVTRIDSLTDDKKIDAALALAPDLLVVLAGTNDFWNHKSPGDLYGSIADTAYLKTTTGGLRYLLDRIGGSLSATARVLFCTPTPGTVSGRADTEPNGPGLRMADCTERLRAVCGEYHVPVCDAWATAGWSAAAESGAPRFTTDGLRLSAEGYGRLAALLAAEAERYCR